MMSSWKWDTMALPRTALLYGIAKLFLLVCFVVYVQSQGVYTQPQLGSFLVLDVEVVHPVHLQVLGNLQILHHAIFSVE